MENKSKIGTIEIRRSKGIEIWNITSGNFSIDKLPEKFRMNFWVESNEDILQRLEDTGDGPIIFEIIIPFYEKPDLKKLWKCKPINFKYIEDDDDFKKYSDNFYYYIHKSFEEIEMEIIPKNEKYQIKVTGESYDPIERKYGKAKYIITATTELKNEFKNYWK